MHRKASFLVLAISLVASVQATADLKKIAVLEFTNEAKLSSFEVETLADDVRQAALIMPADRYLVMTRESMIMLLPPGTDLAKCSGSQCEVEAGRTVGAELVVAGTVGRFSGEFVARLKLFDTHTGALLGQRSAGGANLKALREDLVARGRELFEKLAGPGPAAAGPERTVVGPPAGIGTTPVVSAQVQWIEVGNKKFLTRSEVTVAQYRDCVMAGLCPKPDTGSRCNWGEEGRDNHPVNCVSKKLATAYCDSVGGRLPKASELMDEATQGGLWEYPWGEEKPSCLRAVMDDGGNGCGLSSTMAVCLKPKGISRKGVCDLVGNVAEWVADNDDSLLNEAWGGSWTDTNPKPKRGGSWRPYDLGIRCARDGE